jgi:hypothetical protein
MERYRLDWRSWVLPQRPGRRLPPESLNEPLPVDVQRLENLRTAGSKMRLPHPVRNHLYFKTENDARAAMETLGAEGYTLQIRAEAEASWRVTGVIRLVPTAGSITHMREQLETLCAGLDGHYEGWESPLVY